MSYATTANRPNPRAAIGAIGIPAGFALLLITGLAVTVPLPTDDTPFTGNTIFDEEIVEVEVEPVEIDNPVTSDQPVTQTPQPVDQYRPAPRPDTAITFTSGESGPISDLPGLDGPIGDLPPVDLGPQPAPTPSIDPVAAAPQGNPGTWVRDSDYRSSWIRRGLEGAAGFALEIDAKGRVTNCTITRSTGHRQLDDATCELLRERAGFTPARDSSGEAVAGTFRSTVNWQIP